MTIKIYSFYSIFYDSANVQKHMWFTSGVISTGIQLCLNCLGSQSLPRWAAQLVDHSAAKAVTQPNGHHRQSTKQSVNYTVMLRATVCKYVSWCSDTDTLLNLARSAKSMLDQLQITASCIFTYPQIFKFTRSRLVLVLQCKTNKHVCINQFETEMTLRGVSNCKYLFWL